MADISKEIQQIEKAVYGEEVRGSIRDAIVKINTVSESTDKKSSDAVAQVGQARKEVAETLQEVNNTLEQANKAKEVATTKAEEASTSASTATKAAETATAKAGEASASASTATSIAEIATTKAEEASTSANTATSAAETAITKAAEASSSASTAISAMETAKAKAEEADGSAIRAEEAADRAENIVGIGIATEEKTGVVKPSKDLTITEDGTLGINTVFETLAERANIESGDTWETVLGKISKYFGDIKPHAFLNKITEEYIDSVITEKINNAVQKSMIANNLVTDNTEMVLAAPMGKLLQDQITEQNKNIVDNLENHNLATYIANTQEELNNILNNVPSRYKGDSYYAFFVRILTSLNPPLSGGQWLISGYLESNKGYGIQDARCYSPNSISHYERNYYNKVWSDWDKSITNSDIAGLSNPLQGTAQTFLIPSKKSTIVNELQLKSGTYIITGYALYSTQFSEPTIYTISKDGVGIVTCRGNGIGGGGATPFTILKTDKLVTIQLVLFQDSSSEKNINANTLTALKLA